MLAQLPVDTQAQVQRRLTIRHTPRLTARDEQQRELGLVAQLMLSVPPKDGWTFPYVPRLHYDAQRGRGDPSSAALVSRYGSWVEVCRRAHRFVPAKDGKAQPLISRRPWYTRLPRATYTRHDMQLALRECAGELRRVPSRRAYHRWRLAAQNRRRSFPGYPGVPVVVRFYRQYGGWLAALEDARLRTPPPGTVRVITPSREDAIAVTDFLRGSGFIAAHSPGTSCLEVLCAFDDVRASVLGWPLRPQEVSLWAPETATFDVIGLQTRPSHSVRRRPAVADTNETIPRSAVTKADYVHMSETRSKGRQ
jgi:hypothetical protein